jgi:hypothetical protein
VKRGVLVRKMAPLKFESHIMSVDSEREDQFLLVPHFRHPRNDVGVQFSIIAREIAEVASQGRSCTFALARELTNA